jgi:putative Mn2+ efflux pump MntP
MMETTVFIGGLFLLAVIVWREHNMKEDAEKSGKDYKRWSDPVLTMLAVMGLVLVLSSSGMFLRNSMSTVPILLVPFVVGLMAIRATQFGTKASVYATIGAVTIFMYLILT